MITLMETGAHSDVDQVLRDQARLVDLLPDAVIVLDLDWRILRWNTGAVDMYGWRGEEAIGNPVRDLLKTEFDESFDRIERSLRDHDRWYGELSQSRRDGSRIACECRLVAIRDAGGSMRGFVAIIRDTTALKGAERDLRRRTAELDSIRRTEQALRESEERFRDMADNAPVMVWVTQPDGSCSFVSRSWLQFTGQTFADCLGFGWLEAVHPEDREAAGVEFRQANAEHRHLRVEYRVRRYDGAYRWVIDAAAPRFGADGQYLGYVGSVIDISERKQTEAALRQSEEKLRLALDAAQMGTWDWNVLTGELVWSERCKALFGQAPETAMSYEVFLAAIHPEDRDRIDQAVRNTLEGKGTYDVDMRVPWSDGGTHWISSTGRAFYDEAGNAVRMAGVARDITDRKRSEVALHDAHQENESHVAQLEGILGSMTDGLVIADPEGRVLKFNPAALRMCGFDESFDVRKDLREYADLFELLDANGRRPPLDEWPLNRAVRGEVFANEEFRVRRIDTGMELIGSYSGTPVWDASGRQILAIVTMRDRTEQKRAEEALHHTQKLESIGLLAGGIAHDFNNLLTSILGNASVLSSEVDQAHLPQVETIIQASERAADLTRQLLAYAGKGQFQIRRLHLSKSVEEMTELLRASLPKKVNVQYALEPDLPPVEADPSQIQQVVMNLVLNAAEAIPHDEGGRVSVRTATAKFLPSSPAVTDEISKARLAPGKYVCIEVSDTGCGLDRETRARIFDPFFTTKFTGRGLGLAAVAGILRTQRGAITIDSQPNAGTTFRVFFPAVAATHATHRPPSEASLDGTGTVLVIDDEPMVRDAARIALEHFGYTVLTAGDGREGLDVFDRNRHAVDAVLLDLMMPVLGGEEALGELRRHCPGVRVVLMSGYSESEALRLFADRGASCFVQKPFRARDLAAAVKAVLAGKSRVATDSERDGERLLDRVQ